MQIVPYLNFNGQCEEAFKFYAQCLGGKVVEQHTFGNSPMEKDVPPEFHGKLMHARLVAGDAVLMGSDTPPGRAHDVKNSHIALMFSDAAEGERVFNALAEGGTVQMPFGETFWAFRFGMVADKYGTPWMVNCDRPA